MKSILPLISSCRVDLLNTPRLRLLLAPTPVGTGIVNTTGTASGLNARSALVAPGGRITGLVAPMSNPFLPADLRTLLLTRTGDDANLTGVGAR